MDRKFSTIIWDWNGTLLNDMDICVRSINALLKRRGLPLMDLARYRTLFTFPVIRYYEMIGFDFSKEPYDDVAHEFIAVYLEKLEGAGLFPEVLETLAFFRESGYKQAILSVMEHENLLKSVRSKGIEPFFSMILGTHDHHAHGKSYLTEEIIHSLGVSPAETLFVGDTLHDAEVAAEAGCSCVLIAAGHQDKPRLLGSKVPVVEHIREIMALLD